MSGERRRIGGMREAKHKEEEEEKETIKDFSLQKRHTKQSSTSERFEHDHSRHRRNHQKSGKKRNRRIRRAPIIWLKKKNT